ncbi:hypothetical protein [Longitalea luteola]|uniref:hypothetical protein n=1 Tax=Longitalea luteola TaxID=2812563 RepID=UPI001A95DAA6|nr:hypothetical protein [Longitalea luteola]
MNIKRPLVPGFLKTAEEKLLLNKPGIWSTRTHLVLYYGILFMLFLAGISFLEPNDVRDYSTSDSWTGFVIMIAIIALTVWLIYLLRFNVFKKYGLISPFYSLMTFCFYFISTGIIVLFTYVHPVVESVRANLAFDDEELVHDINAMNLRICQLEYNALQEPWDYDTIVRAKNLKVQQYAPDLDYDETATVDTEPKNGKYDLIRYDTVIFDNIIKNADSVVKLNDTMYLDYKTPDFTFVDSYLADEYTKAHIFTSFEIYNKVLRHPPKAADRETISKELAALFNKYDYAESGRSTAVPEINNRMSTYDKISAKYKIGYIYDNISHIVSKKYRWSERHMAEYVRIFYYFTLGITLLIFIFRHSTVRTFFLSLLAAVLLTILTALMMSFSHADETGFLIWMIMYTILFFFGSLATWTTTKRNVITGIMTNLFVFIVPIFPLLIVALYYMWKKDQLSEQGLPTELPDMGWHIMCSEIGGALLFLVLVSTYIGKVYRRWYSLPEN